MRQHDVEGRAPAGAAAFEEGRLKPAAMLVGALEIHDLVRSAVDEATDAGKPWKMNRVLKDERVGRPGIEPDLHQIVDFFVIVGLVRGAKKPLLRALGEPGVGAFLLENRRDPSVHVFVEQHLVPAVAYEDRQRNAPGALPRQDPVGPARDHAANAVLAGRRNPSRLSDRLERDRAQRLPAGRAGEGPVHRQEPLRRIAEDHRLLGAPAMRILVLEPAAARSALRSLAAP